MLSGRLARSSLVLCVGVLTSCIVPSDDVGADGVGDGDGGDGDGDGESSSGVEGGSEAGTSANDSESDSTGEPCGPAEVTEVETCPAIVGEGFCSDPVSHVPTDTMIEWSHNPPHSGPHFPIWETEGEHLEPVERGYWVHNLEHGWIILVYNCPDGCEPELDLLRSLFEARPDVTFLMTEDPLLDPPRFAAISWTWVYEFDVPVVEELLCFADQHFDHAPESVHPG
ncbi:DUF3105 domain-containing protein [Nannocystaceae bacterium ST9]